VDIIINGEKRKCHCFNEDNIEIGYSIEMIIDGSYKPKKSGDITVIRHNKGYGGKVAYFHNDGEIAKIGFYQEG